MAAVAILFPMYTLGKRKKEKEGTKLSQFGKKEKNNNILQQY